MCFNQHQNELLKCSAFYKRIWVIVIYSCFRLHEKFLLQLIKSRSVNQSNKLKKKLQGQKSHYIKKSHLLSHYSGSFDSMLIIQIQVNETLEWNKVEVLFMQYWQHSVFCLPRCIALYEEGTLFFISLWLQGVHLWSALSVFQDKLLEEMWKQQDSLEAPAATAAETPASPEAGGGSEENTKDSNPLLERLRALEVKWIAGLNQWTNQHFFLTYHRSVTCALWSKSGPLVKACSVKSLNFVSHVLEKCCRLVCYSFKLLFWWYQTS